MPEEPKRTSDKATASLVLGLVPFISTAVVGVLVYAFGGLLLSIFLGVSIVLLAPAAGVLAVINGHRARASIRQSAGQLQGGRIATTGLTLGYVGLVCWILVIITFFPTIDPNRVVANEASTVGSLRTINTAAMTYAQSYNHGYPPTLAAMGPPMPEKSNASAVPSERATGLIDEILATGMKSGYRVTYIAGPSDSAGKIQTYAVHADPSEPGVSGKMYYFTDQSSVIRVEKGKEATQNSPPIQ